MSTPTSEFARTLVGLLDKEDSKNQNGSVYVPVEEEESKSSDTKDQKPESEDETSDNEKVESQNEDENQINSAPDGFQIASSKHQQMGEQIVSSEGQQMGEHTAVLEAVKSTDAQNKENVTSKQAEEATPSNDTASNVEIKKSSSEDYVVVSEEPICLIGKKDSPNAMFPVNTETNPESLDIEHVENPEDSDSDVGDSVAEALEKVNKAANKPTVKKTEKPKTVPMKKLLAPKKGQVSFDKPEQGTEEAPISNSERVWESQEEIMRDARSGMYPSPFTSSFPFSSSAQQMNGNQVSPQLKGKPRNTSRDYSPNRSSRRRDVSPRRSSRGDTSPRRRDRSPESSPERRDDYERTRSSRRRSDTDDSRYKHAQKVVVVHHHHYY
jgi:hypothetical protein